MNEEQVSELRQEVTARTLHLDSFQVHQIEEAIYTYYYHNKGLDYENEAHRGLLGELSEDTLRKYRKLVAEITRNEPNKKPKRRVEQHSNLLNGVSLVATLGAILIKPEVLLHSLHGKKVNFTQCDLNTAAQLILNIDETGILLDPGDSIQAVTNADSLELMKQLNLSISVSSAREDGEEATKKRSVQLFAITSADGCIRGIINHIYDRCCTKVRVWKVNEFA